MTSWVVSDSGILIATALTETHSEFAAALWEQWDNTEFHVAVPSLFRYEIVATIRKHVFRGTISPEEGLIIRNELLAKPVQLFFDDSLIRRAYDLATQFNRPSAYDAQYLAVAEMLNCEFWTMDERLFNAVRSSLPWVKFVGNFSLDNENNL